MLLDIAKLELTSQIKLLLDSGQEVLLNFSGGSNIELVAQILMQAKSKNSQLLHLAPVDERWDSDPHHSRSNWQALRLRYKSLVGDELEDAGFTLHPILTGKDLATCASEFSKILEPLLSFKVFTLLGVGEDGHVAGIMLHKKSNLFEQEGVIGYPLNVDNVDMENPHLDKTISARLTPGFPLLQRLINSGETVIVASGSSKLAVLQKLLGKEKLARESFPAVVLREGIESGRIKVYTDSENIKVLEG